MSEAQPSSNEQVGPKQERWCYGCKYLKAERFEVQGDRGTDYTCMHGDSDRAIASYAARTPEWCPVVTTVEPKADWRCFHCGDVFTDEQSARDHFGPNQGSDPACAIDVTEYRRMEEVNRGHCAEDTELHRALDAKSAEMMRAVRQAEEEGYNKGLQDGRASEPPGVGVEDAIRLSREGFINGYREGRADGLLEMESCEQKRADKYVEELRTTVTKETGL